MIVISPFISRIFTFQMLKCALQVYKYLTVADCLSLLLNGSYAFKISRMLLSTHQDHYPCSLCDRCVSFYTGAETSCRRYPADKW